MSRSAAFHRFKDAILKRFERFPRVHKVLAHEAGPFTIFFWAPAWKWGLVFAGIADLKRPIENLSVPQNTALALTGLIWSRYALVISPVNYNLLSVNLFVAATGIYQLHRINQGGLLFGKKTAPQPESSS
eukprot:TRINITY_DN663_c0_g1_i4.p2 TRINITY_DN663_c0_g1~~TRINITY_DN663_c0_g1_i4.p2  ORF type:complete len:130 (+),score=30.92 TRINITY_DN663_c0_g1_i4:88-477(+)